MPVHKSNNTKDISLTILKGLALGSFIAAAMIFPGLALILKDSSPRYRHFEKNSFKKSLWYLKKKKYIQISRSRKRTILKISAAGKKHLTEAGYSNLQIKRPVKWDAKWRVIVFDIPEQYKNNRDTLRRKLKSLDFYPLQKSMYVHPYECQQELDLILETLKLSPFVIYLTTAKDRIPSRVHNFFRKKKLF